MRETTNEFESACRDCLSRYFSDHPDASLEKRATKALRLLARPGQPLAGKPEGWALGIVYSLANLDRRRCGFNGALNAEIEERFGVSMGTIRKRAARVQDALTI